MELAAVSITKLAGGFGFIEGPVVHADGRITFSDIRNNRILRYGLDGSIQTIAEGIDRTNGLALDTDERIIICEGGARRLSRREHDGTIVALVDHVDGKRLNSPNDVIVTPNGEVYFTDPPWSVAREDRELQVRGVYRVDPDGQVTLVSGKQRFPNGLALSPDGRLLYVSNSVPPAEQCIYVYDRQPDGSLGPGRRFAAMLSEAEEEGVPDGMKVDAMGNIFCTGPGGIWVFRPGGELMGKIVAPEIPANCAFSRTGETLYLTARTSLYAADVSKLL